MPQSSVFKQSAKVILILSICDIHHFILKHPFAIHAHRN